MNTEYKIAGVDVHKKMLAVVVVDSGAPELSFERRKFGATHGEIKHLLAWLEQRGVQQVVMESTAQYWKPIWQALEGFAFSASAFKPGTAGAQDRFPGCRAAGEPIFEWRFDPEFCAGTGAKIVAKFEP